jgi:type IV secretory pathway VirB4 component
MTSQLQSCLNELDNILNSLMSSNFYFQFSLIYDPIVTDKEFKSLKPSLNTLDPLIDILFESMVIQLYKLFEVQPFLAKCLKDSGKIDLLRILKDSWSRIERGRDKIIFWRNKFISHSRDQSLNYVSYHILDSKYNETRKIIVSSSRYAVTYIWAVLSNIHSEYMGATLIKEEEKNSMIKLDGTEILTKAILDEKYFWKDVNEQLKKKGYRPVAFCGYEEWPMKMVGDISSI